MPSKDAIVWGLLVLMLAVMVKLIGFPDTPVKDFPHTYRIGDVVRTPVGLNGVIQEHFTLGKDPDKTPIIYYRVIVPGFSLPVVFREGQLTIYYPDYTQQKILK